MGRQLVARESATAPSEVISAVRRRWAARVGWWSAVGGLGLVAAVLVIGSIGPWPSGTSGVGGGVDRRIMGAGTTAGTDDRSSTSATMANLRRLNSDGGASELVLPEGPRAAWTGGGADGARAPVPTARDAYRVGGPGLP